MSLKARRQMAGVVRLALSMGHAYQPLAVAALGALFAHFLKCTDAAFVACAAGLYALTDPDFLLGQFLIEDGLLLRLAGEEFSFALQVSRVVALPAGELAAVEIEDFIGDALDEGAVV